MHILKGDVPEVTDGRILGQEGTGIIEEVGSAVTAFKKGDRVLISCISSCGKCTYCRKGMYSHCEKVGGILGHLIDGTQAEYVRIPFADTSLYPSPEHTDEDAMVMLSDILPTGFECGVLNGQVQPGDTVVIVGAGPIGLAVLLTAQFYTPAAIIMVDVDDNRLAVAKTLGATHTINSQQEDPVKQLMLLTQNIRSRRGRGSGGHSGHLRTVRIHHCPGRANCQCGYTRQKRESASGNVVVQKHYHYHPAGRYGIDGDAVKNRNFRESGSGQTDYASFCPEGHY